MVGISIEDVKKNFRSFINRISKMRGKRLNKDELRDFSIQVQILARLLELKAFILQVEGLDKVKKSVLSRGSIDDEDINDLNKILEDI